MKYQGGLMRILKLAIILIIAGLFSFGAVCGGKQKPTLTPPKAAQQPQEEVGLEKQPVEKIEPPVVDEVSLALGNIYFDFDKSELEPEAREMSGRYADKLRENPQMRIRIEGHCDDRGTEQYNLALGEKRAFEAKKFLMSSGIAGERIDIISYGEEHPADPGQNEGAWAKNRRAEFKILR